MPDQFHRDRFQRRLSAMKAERETFDDHWKTLAEFVSPRRGRFFRNERNKGGRHFWNQIINGRATWALRVATAGIFNGIMSPSRPWLVLETDDPDVSEFGPAKEWFFIVQETMRRIFNESNLYNMAPVMLREELLFGTGCMSHVDDPFDVARFYTHTVGSYFLAQNDRFVIDTVAREFEMTTEQIVSQFSTGRDINPAISPAVRNQYAMGNYDTWFPVVQFVAPNDRFDRDSRRATQRRFRSVYYEPGNTDKDAFLSDRGFEEFPFYTPRWEVTNEDIYATDCPGMTTLGDVRQLQLEEKRKAQGIDKMVSPPLHGPAVLSNIKVSSLPNGGTFYDAPGGDTRGLRPIYEVQPRIAELLADMQHVEDRIDRGFYVDLFMAISAMEGVQPRNQLELMQRNQERLLQLGPTLERQFGEFLTPLVDRTFGQMLRAGLLPPPPEVLQGRALKPRFVSSLAMAQQVVTTGNIDRLATFVQVLAPVFPNVVDKFDADQAVDEYASLTGAPPKLVRSDDAVDALRQARAEQQAQAEQLAMAQQIGNVAKLAGDTKIDEGTLAGALAGRQ